MAMSLQTEEDHVQNDHNYLITSDTVELKAATNILVSFAFLSLNTWSNMIFIFQMEMVDPSHFLDLSISRSIDKLPKNLC